MARLIDIDTASKYLTYYDPCYKNLLDGIEPEFDIVMCKDCKYARQLNDAEKRIYLDECMACCNGDATIDGYNIVMPEHYCSYGKRRG